MAAMRPFSNPMSVVPSRRPVTRAALTTRSIMPKHSRCGGVPESGAGFVGVCAPSHVRSNLVPERSCHDFVELAIELADDLMEAVGKPRFAVTRARKVDVEGPVD